MKADPPLWAKSLAIKLGLKALERAEPETLQHYGEKTISQLAFCPTVPLGPDRQEMPEKLELAAGFLQLLAQVLAEVGSKIARAEAPQQVVDTIIDGLAGQGEDLTEIDKWSDALLASFRSSPSLADVALARARMSELTEVPSIFRTRFEQALELAEQFAKSCLVKVLCRGIHGEPWQGSGFVCGGRNHPLILTARHVIEGAQSVEVETASGDRRGVNVIAAANGRDLALLAPDGLWEYPTQLCRIGLKMAEELRGRLMLHVGFHAQGVTPLLRIKDACASIAQVVLFSPLRKVEFLGGGSQPCLIMVVGHDQETVREGMSGGPIMDLETGEIVAVIIAAQWERINQPYPFQGSIERLPVAEYAFGTLIQEALEHSPELWSYFPNLN